MRLSLLCMISANSLSAFSGTTATVSLSRPSIGAAGSVQPARLLRGTEQPGTEPGTEPPLDRDSTLGTGRG